MPFHLVNQVGNFVDCIKSNIMGGSRKVRQRLFLSAMYFTEGHTNLPRDTIGRGSNGILSEVRTSLFSFLAIYSYLQVLFLGPHPHPGMGPWIFSRKCGLKFECFSIIIQLYWEEHQEEGALNIKMDRLGHNKIMEPLILSKHNWNPFPDNKLGENIYPNRKKSKICSTFGLIKALICCS